MRTFIFAAAAIVAASCAIDRAQAADGIPDFDVARNCSADVASVGIGSGLAACKKDETDARNELDTRWRQFGASDKQACIVESSTGGDQSYVELLTCLEMSTGQFDDRRQMQTGQLSDDRSGPSPSNDIR
jgi:hypothetical protein